VWHIDRRRVADVLLQRQSLWIPGLPSCSLKISITTNDPPPWNRAKRNPLSALTRVRSRGMSPRGIANSPNKLKHDLFIRLFRSRDLHDQINMADHFISRNRGEQCFVYSDFVHGTSSRSSSDIELRKQEVVAVF
jgi:hypothetical protein